MGCLLRAALAFLLAVGAAPWGAWLVAREPRVASTPHAVEIGLVLFAVVGGLVGWVLGGVAWKALKAVVLAGVILAALALAGTGWTAWLNLPSLPVP